MALLASGIISGARCLAAEALQVRVERIAAGLGSMGVARGDCVAILMRNDIAFLEAAYGAQKIGAYAVPINWHFKGDEVAHILADCGAKVLFAHADLMLALTRHLPAGVAVVELATPPEVAAAYGFDPVAATAIAGAQEFEAFIAQQAAYAGPQVSAPLAMFYTSGTTGRPKGVRRAQPTPAQMTALERVRRDIMGLKPGIRAAVPGPLYHSAPNSFAMHAGRIAQAMIIMPRFDPVAMLELIERERIDTMFMVPTMFVRLLQLPEAVRSRYDVSSLKFVIHAAAPCPSEVKRAMIEWWGPVINEFYGSTESGAVTFATSADFLARPGSVGKASKGAELRILDETGRPLPAGAVGEIFSRTAELPDFTYHNQPQERASVDREGFVTSGDVGYLDQDGYLFLCDRKRDMVISGGVNIYPAEIEAVLQGMAGVKDCAVFGIPDAEFGERLLAVVEPLEGAVLDVEGLRAQLRLQLADYKVPRTIEIAFELPREDSGKIFKRRLRDAFWQKTGRQI
jgi:long-chain acyl-CoA synthetase